MQNIPEGLIPFDYEKYKTGNYIAETRGGFRPDDVVYLKGAEQPVIFLTKQFIIFVSEDGMYLNEEAVHNSDLFLRPKTVKKWIPMFTNMLYDSEEECTKKWIDSTFLKAIEVEVTEQ